MATEQQIAANRENAQKSTGPRTEEGKRRSALNATRHGFSGQVIVMPADQLERYIAFRARIIARLAPSPEDDMLSYLAHSYADAEWQIDTMRGVQRTLFTLGNIEEVAENLNLEDPEIHNCLSNAKTYREESVIFDRIGRHINQLETAASKVLQKYRHFEAERFRREEAEIVEATEIYHACRKAGAVFEPQKFGFVLTVSKIERRLTRQLMKNPVSVGEMVKNGYLKSA